MNWKGNLKNGRKTKVSNNRASMCIGFFGLGLALCFFLQTCITGGFPPMIIQTQTKTKGLFKIKREVGERVSPHFLYLIELEGGLK